MQVAGQVEERQSAIATPNWEKPKKEPAIGKLKITPSSSFTQPSSYVAHKDGEVLLLLGLIYVLI